MIRKLARVFLLSFLSLLTLYLTFLSIISISTGLTNTDRPGFWMPIMCGMLILCLTTFPIRLMLYIVRQGKDRYPYI
jgi:hypothetical protein